MTNNAMPAKAEEPKNDIRSLIVSDNAKKQFAMALPKHLTVDRFVRVALTAINKTPKLATCTRESLLSCLLDCSSLGLEPDGRKAHLIPYGDKCTLIVDYKGLVELARRSGEISDIHSDIVYDCDFFKFEFGTNATLRHIPDFQARRKAKIEYVYSFVKLKDGSTSFEVMGADDVDAIRKRSKASGSGPWVTDYNEMAKKTVFRRHSKWLPVSSEFTEAVEKDYDTPDFVASAVPDMMPKETPEALPTVGADATPEAVVNADQARNLLAIAQGCKVIEVDLLNHLAKTYGIEAVTDLKAKDLDAVLKWVGENRKIK